MLPLTLLETLMFGESIQKAQERQRQREREREREKVSVSVLPFHVGQVVSH